MRELQVQFVRLREDGMRHLHINLLAVLVATVIRLVLGAAWYARPVFGRVWSAETGCSEDAMKAQLPKALATDFVCSFIMMFVLAHMVLWAKVDTAATGAFVGFLNWLGFVAMVQIITTVYEKKSFKLFFINSGFILINLLIGGAIMGVWR